MKIGLVSIPPRTAYNNPYQNLFYRELEKFGFEVHDNLYFRFSDIIHNRKMINVFHFHWYPASEDNMFHGWADTFKAIIKLILARSLGIKVVWTAHNLLPHDIRYYRLQYFRRWVLVHMCSVIIVHFEEAKNKLHTMFRVSKSKMICIHHGSYEGWYPNTIDKSSAREILGIPQDNIVFLCLGLIRPYKGVEELIRGFQELAKGRFNITLLLAGRVNTQEYQEELLKVIREDPQIRCYFNSIPDIDLQRFFNAADCCVFLYKRIFTSGSALLATTFRRPILINKCDFSEEYFTPQNSILLENLDASTIKTSIEEFCSNIDSYLVTEEFQFKFKWEEILSETTVNSLLGMLYKR